MDGLAWEDSQNQGEVAYWFPAYLQQGEESKEEINLISQMWNQFIKSLIYLLFAELPKS